MTTPTATKTPSYVLPLLVLSTLMASSVWFAANAVIPALTAEIGQTISAGDITTAVQFGFIVGTFTFAGLALADRFSPCRVFLVSCVFAGLCNMGVAQMPDSGIAVLAARFGVGFFLAGIYPVAMKIAFSWYPKGLGIALGFLVGALVLGTAFPHLVRALGQDFSWRLVIYITSGAAVIGGLVVGILLGDGPNRGKPGALHPLALIDAFRQPDFRASASGYFGHMWELYTFWAFVPLWLGAYATQHQLVDFDISLWSFWIIAAGALGCVGGGLITPKCGPARVAGVQLFISGMLCLLSPLLFMLPPTAFLLVLLIWGVTVAGDSPQFSTLNALNAPSHLAGSALTIVNCIGFTISIISLQVVEALLPLLATEWLFFVLVPGPLLGLISFRRLLHSS